MRIALFYHSLESDWNHGNAHFLRGIATELVSRGHSVRVFEPEDSWSRANLVAEHGSSPIEKFRAAYPALHSTRYAWRELDLDRALDGVDLVIVHEWNAPELVSRIGRHHRKNQGYALLFHDTHHRMVTDPGGMGKYDLSAYDGVLAYGEVLRELYECGGQAPKAWVWHEAADTRVFHPVPGMTREGELVWVGNWGDDERAAELREFLIEPAKNLRLKSRIYGVRYPREARRKLREAGFDYRGWLANFEAPTVFAQHRVTVHVPRRPYVRELIGIPTIRVFEALACGIPLLCSPWNDCENLFRPGTDYLIAQDGREMEEKLRAVLDHAALAQSLARHGLETIQSRHTCAHRVNELLAIYSEITGRNPAAGPSEPVQPSARRMEWAEESSL